MSSLSSSAAPSNERVYYPAMVEGKKGGSGTARVVGSATAGLVELMVFHPVDTIAKRLMTTTEKYIVPGKTLENLNKVIFRKAADAGVLTKVMSLFPGLGFAGGYKVSQRVYKFGGQPFVNDLMNRHAGAWFRSRFGEKQGKQVMHALSGSILGVGEILLLPLDILKIKAQTNPQALAGSNIFKIFLSEGRNLYAGAGWTAARNAPGSFALFGGAAFTYGSIFHLDDYKKATFAQNFVASIAGAVASISVSAPLDVIKTRVQKSEFGKQEKGMVILTRLLKEEGVSALFKGLTPKILMVGPKLVFSFTIAQYLITRLEKVL